MISPGNEHDYGVFQSYAKPNWSHVKVGLSVIGMIFEIVTAENKIGPVCFYSLGTF